MKTKIQTQLNLEEKAAAQKVWLSHNRLNLMAKRAEDRKKMVGNQFDNLLVLDHQFQYLKNKWYCFCACSCGNKKWIGIDGKKLKQKSCGCLKGKNSPVKHGQYRGDVESKTHMAWRSMLNRCYGSKPQHVNYRKRGIQVCNRWRFGENGESPFDLFFKDVGHPPDSSYSLDRINNNGNYEPCNVRWATAKQQAENRCDSKFLTLKGESKLLTQWCRELNWPYSVIWNRIQNGWSDEEILTTPKGVRRCRRTIK